MRRCNHNVTPMSWIYPVINKISSSNAVLGNQRLHREKYFTMGAVAKQKQVFKLGKGVLQFKGKSQFYTKRWKVWWKGKTFLIYFLVTDESNVIWHKTIKIAWLYTPNGVHRQFCALKYAAWVCPSYFWLWWDSFDFFCITILVCFPFLFQPLVFKLLLKDILA